MCYYALIFPLDSHTYPLESSTHATDAPSRGRGPRPARGRARPYELPSGGRARVVSACRGVYKRASADVES